MYETSKAIDRRLKDTLFLRAIKGKGIDIGAGTDSLNKEGEFGKDCNVISFDKKMGNADNMLDYYGKDTFDFIYSSHCLEHIKDVKEAFKTWLDILKPGGYGVIALPDEDLYEQGYWPSKWAGEGHRHSFTIYKKDSWSPASINVVDFFAINFSSIIKILSIRLIDDNYDYLLSNIDQTIGKAETTIEIIFRKKE